MSNMGNKDKDLNLENIIKDIKVVRQSRTTWPLVSKKDYDSALNAYKKLPAETKILLAMRAVYSKLNQNESLSPDQIVDATKTVIDAYKVRLQSPSPYTKFNNIQELEKNMNALQEFSYKIEMEFGESFGDLIWKDPEFNEVLNELF